MIESKLKRARAIRAHVLENDDEHGGYVPAVGAAGNVTARNVHLPKARWRARITPDRRITIARHHLNVVGDVIVTDKGWDLLQVHVDNVLVLAANFRGDEIDLHYFKPGAWEQWLGVDNEGDTLLFTRMPFGDSRSPEWQLVEQSPDFQLPPLRGGEAPLPPSMSEAVGANP